MGKIGGEGMGVDMIKILNACMEFSMNKKQNNNFNVIRTVAWV